MDRNKSWLSEPIFKVFFVVYKDAINAHFFAVFLAVDNIDHIAADFQLHFHAIYLPRFAGVTKFILGLIVIRFL